MPSVSVVLPCYNEDKNIPATVADVVAWFDKTGLSGEIVTVNDGSKDTTAQVLETLSQKDSRIKVVTHTVNQGYGAAVRSGCDAATMDVIAFINSESADCLSFQKCRLWHCCPLRMR